MISKALDRFLTEAWSSLRKFEAAEGTYQDVVSVYQEAFGTGVTADFKARSDIDLRTAVCDAGYYRDRAQTYLLAALVQLAIDDHPDFAHQRPAVNRQATR